MQAVGLKISETKEEPWGQVAEAKLMCRRTEVGHLRLRTKVKAEGRQSPMDQKGEGDRCK